MSRESAGGAKSVVGESRMDLGEALEGFPGGGFADGDVGIFGFKFLASGGIGDADGESHGDQRKE